MLLIPTSGIVKIVTGTVTVCLQKSFFSELILVVLDGGSVHSLGQIEVSLSFLSS